MLLLRSNPRRHRRPEVLLELLPEARLGSAAERLALVVLGASVDGERAEEGRQVGLDREVRVDVPREASQEAVRRALEEQRNKVRVQDRLYDGENLQLYVSLLRHQ